MPETASSAAVSETPVADSGDRTNRWTSYAPPVALALIVGAMTAVMLASRRDGHWWGDDWALYIRQAQSLVDGNPQRVIDQNLFTVESSRGAAFSPPLYPWGFPLILAPFVAVVGPDVDRLTIVPVLCAAVFACCWYALAKPRLGVIPALVGVVAVTMTPLLVGWAELIQSEWPFLAVAGMSLVALDRLASTGAFTDLTAPVWPMVAMGVGASAAFSVRREGLAVIGAIAAAQLAALVDRRMLERWRTGDRVALAARLLTPHTAALVTVGLVQVLLPSTLVPQYSGTSVWNVWKFRNRHIDHLAEVSGLKRTWQDDPVVLGSSTVGWIAVVAYLTLAVAGMVLAVAVYRRRDLHLVAYVFGAMLIGGSFRSAINRYVVSIAPLLVLLGLVAVFAAGRLLPWRHTATVVVTVVVSLLAIGNVIQARSRLETATAFADTNSIEWGPTHPDAIEMFEAVRQFTEPDEIVAAPKARAMTLVTGRLAVQVDQYRAIPDSVPVSLVVVETGTDLADELSEPSSGYVTVWENTRFILFEPAA